MTQITLHDTHTILTYRQAVCGTVLHTADLPLACGTVLPTADLPLACGPSFSCSVAPQSLRCTDTVLHSPSSALFTVVITPIPVPQANLATSIQWQLNLATSIQWQSNLATSIKWQLVLATSIQCQLNLTTSNLERLLKNYTCTIRVYSTNTMFFFNLSWFYKCWLLSTAVEVGRHCVSNPVHGYGLTKQQVL